MIVTLHRDRHIQILDKPVGIPVVPARDGGSSVAGQTGLRVCHRLDRETSGCLVMARSLAGQRMISAAFAEGRVHKEYLAVVVGSPPDEGEIDLAIGEWKRGRVKIGEGRPAQTRFKVLWREPDAPGGGLAGVLAMPLTGRTHQIRAHLASIGAPLLGDPTYGGPEADRLYLHAWRIRLPWPGPGDETWAEAPPPPGFLR